MEAQTEQPIKLIWGTEEIAKLIGRTQRQTSHLLSKRAIPAKKVGGRWVAEESKLMSFLLGEKHDA